MTQLLTHPLFRAYDASGDPLAGGKLYSYEPGTSTPKATYDEDGNANTNPVVLDSEGKAIVYLSGSYKLNLLDSSDVQQGGWPRDNITGVGLDYGDFHSNAFYPDATAADQGVTGDNNTIKYYVDQAGSNVGALVLSRGSSGANTTYTLSTTETIPSTLALIIEPGAIISDGGGAATLTINGPISAGAYQCFNWTGSGAVNGSPKISEFPVEWFGVTGDATDERTHLVDAVNFSGTSKVPVVIANMDIYISATVTPGVDAEIIAHNSSIKRFAADNNFILFTVTSDNFSITGLDMYGEGSHSTGGDSTYSAYTAIYIDQSDNHTFTGCGFYEIDDYGIFAADTDDTLIEKCTFENASPLAAGSRGRVGVALGKRTTYGGGDNFRVLNSKFNNLSTSITSVSNVAGDETGYTEDIQQLQFIGNESYNMSEHGVYIGTGSFHVVNNNTVKNVWQNGIKTHSLYTTICGNTVDSSGTMGATSASIATTGLAKGCNISGNTVTGAKIGIIVDGTNLGTSKTSQGVGATFEATGHVISNNVIYCFDPSNSADRTGIRSFSDNTERVYFGDNIFSNNTIIGFNTGIWIDYQKNSVVKGNMVVGDGTYVSAPYGSGLVVDNRLDGTVFEGNTVLNFPGDGILLNNPVSGTGGIIFRGNTSAGNAGYGINWTVSAGSPTLIFEGNTLFNNTSGDINNEATQYYDNIVAGTGTEIKKQHVNSFVLHDTGAAVGDATTNGKARISATVTYSINGLVYTKASTDDLFDISAAGFQTGAAEYRKVLLVLSSAGTGNGIAGDVAASQAAAKLPHNSGGRCAVGVVEIPNNYTGGDLAGYTFYDIIGPWSN